MTKQLDDGELTPADFLRQLSYNNEDLTEQFMKFYDSAAPYDESSDDEVEDCSSQASSECSQATTSSAMTDMQIEVPLDRETNDVVVDKGTVHSTFEQANGDDSPIDQQLFDLSNKSDPYFEHSYAAHASFEDSNEDEPEPSICQSKDDSIVSPLPKRSSAGTCSPVHVPIERFQIRQLKIVLPSAAEVANEIAALQKKSKQQKNREELEVIFSSYR